jgi:hypothetical protein
MLRLGQHGAIGLVGLHDVVLFGFFSVVTLLAHELMARRMVPLQQTARYIEARLTTMLIVSARTMSICRTASQ